MEGFGDDIEALLVGVVGEPAALYGHSLGGQVAVQVAARRPDLVRELILGDAPFDRARLRAAIGAERARLELWRDLSGPGLPLGEIRRRLPDMPVAGGEGVVPAKGVFGEDNPWFDFMAETLGQHDPAMLDAVIKFDRMHAAYDYERLLPRIECPALIIQADPALGGMSDEEVERGLALLRNGRAVKLEGIGHPLYHPDPEPVVRAITEFLEAL
jgi:pimeloyl-ACP methyl ester carboxylesterase